MARIPCSFSAQEEFVEDIDARAAELGMKRSEYIVHALRREIQQSGGLSFNVVAEVTGDRNKVDQSLSTSASPAAPAGKRASYKGKKSTAKKKPKK